MRIAYVIPYVGDTIVWPWCCLTMDARDADRWRAWVVRQRPEAKTLTHILDVRERPSYHAGAETGPTRERAQALLDRHLTDRH